MYEYCAHAYSDVWLRLEHSRNVGLKSTRIAAIHIKPYRLFLSRGQSLLVQLWRNIWRRTLGNIDDDDDDVLQFWRQKAY